MGLDAHVGAVSGVSESVDRFQTKLHNSLAYVFHPTTYSQYFHPASYAFVEYGSPLVLDRSGLKRRCRTNGTLSYYDRQREVEIEPPAGTDHPPAIETRIGTATVAQPFVGSLRNVRLVGGYPLPVDRRGNLVLEAVVSPEVLALNGIHSLTDVVSNPRGRSRRNDDRNGAAAPRSIDRAVLLYNCWNRGYFHWTVETLARLEGVEAYRERTGHDLSLIVGPNPTRFQRESLALLGYDEDDLIRWDRRYATVEEFVVPSVRRELNPGEASPVAHWWLHERLREAATTEAPDAGRDASSLVYVSREDAEYRRIANEDEVLDRLEPYGFEKYVLSERSMAEDIQLFANADVIVAPHGAGLTNVLYAEDATVVELFRENHLQPVYFLLSKQLGLDYRYLLCPYEGTDIVVDVDQLESIVAEAVAEQAS